MADYIKRKEVSIASVAPATLGGKPVIEVVTDEATKDGRLRYHLYFQPVTWAIVGATLRTRADRSPEKTAILQIRIAYGAGTPLRMKSMEAWGEFPPGVKGSGEKYEVKSTEFGPIAKEKFTLAAFGLEEPVVTRSSAAFTWFLLINAAIFVALGIWFGIRYVRRRRA